ncbi:hypothetical protein VE02_09047 [Pseudogymnoascus sp. 03VT05]|nr:hypothetical protein VE02_09047 [Pseudogymnoascus sp. 03VT05]
MITNIYMITAIAVVGGTLFGFDLSSMSAIIGTNQYKCYFNHGPHGQPFDDSPNCSGPTPLTQGGITASMPGGSFISSVASGFISDQFGRRTSLQIGCVIWLLGSAISCAAQNIPMLVVGRFINGLSVGICSAQGPVFIAELSTPARRGLVVGTQQWAITWGILIMFYLSYGCSFFEGTIAFRLPWGLQAIPGLLLFAALFFVPESPRWLAYKDRWEDCHQVLAMVHAKGDLNHPFVERELQELKEACEFDRNNADHSVFELFQGKMLWRAHIGIFTQIWSQLSGINVIMYYITYVFAMAGLSGNANLVASSISYVINMVTTIIALFYVDKFGRRWLLLTGSASLALWWFVCGGVMGVYGSPAPPGGVDNIPAVSWQIHGAPSKAIIASSYLIVASFAPTWGPVSWIYPPELFPLRLRGKAVAISTSANWIFNFALSFLVPICLENIKWKTYILFGTFCAAMGIHVFFCFPETAGKTLEEIDSVFESRTPPWRTHVQSQTPVASNKLEDIEKNVSPDTKDSSRPETVSQIEDANSNS